jgi:hypothetical protein
MKEPISPSLENLRKAEEENVGITTRMLGETLSLVDDLRGLYDWVAAELCKPGGAERCPDVVPGIPLLRASQYHLHSAVLSCLRCHVTDSCSASRMAIESAAVLAKMHRRPEVARLWMEAGVDDQAAREYRRATSGPELFPQGDAELEDLKRHYDLCAKQTHPGFASMVRRLRAPAPAGPSQIGLEFRWFDIGPESKGEPARAFLWIVDTHLKILDLYARVFKAALDETAWMLRRNVVEARHVVHTQRWIPAIAQSDAP